MLPALSVVIPTHNRRDSLLRLLAALERGTLPAERFEAVVVADGCADDTVRAGGGRVVLVPRAGVRAAAGRGAAAAGTWARSRRAVPCSSSWTMTSSRCRPSWPRTSTSTPATPTSPPP
ncbi:MAG: glycosyltransferase [Gemmatimonadetes bacterium]|nr:glycosyltransferase [Gemmatimonadota bacterium]